MLRECSTRQQIKDGKGWRVIHRARTDAGGKFVMRYRFTQTFTPTTYTSRAQVPDQSGYPRGGGNSKSIEIPVRP